MSSTNASSQVLGLRSSLFRVPQTSSFRKGGLLETPEGLSFSCRSGNLVECVQKVRSVGYEWSPYIKTQLNVDGVFFNRLNESSRTIEVHPVECGISPNINFTKTLTLVWFHRSVALRG